MGNTADFYEVLSIPKDSSSQEIRRAYRELVKKWHPDKHPPSNKLEAEARFKAITQAYEVATISQLYLTLSIPILFHLNSLMVSLQALHDRQCRSMFGVYNEVGGENEGPNRAQKARASDRGVPPRSPPVPATPGNEFKDVYYSNPKFTFSGSQRRKPPPVERKLECTLEELCRGCKKEINFTRDVITKDGPIVGKQETQTIKVKPGWKKGTKITFEGMGDERPGCVPADVVFSIAEKEHPFFKRVGNDLVLKVEIPLVNALTGWTFSFRLLNGERMSCSFNDEIVYPGYEKIIQGQGMPVASEKGTKGDLRIKFSIKFPKQLSEDQRASIREVLRSST